MYCQNCGKEIQDNSRVCSKCGCSLEIDMYADDTISTKIKNFILKIGRFLIDFNAVLGIGLAGLFFIFCIILAFGKLQPDINGYFEYLHLAWLFLALAVITPLVIIFWVVVYNFLIYLLIDIKDSLEKIEMNTREKQK